MIKKLLVAGIVLLTVSAVGLYLAFTNLPKLVKVEIEQQGSRTLGVSVRIGGVELTAQSPDSILRLTRLTIANPPGFSDAAAIAIAELSIRYDTKGSDAKKIVVREILASGVTVAYEGRARDSNLEILQRNALAEIRARAPGRAAELPKLFLDSFSTEIGQLTVAHEVLPGTRLAAVMPSVSGGGIGRRENGAIAPEFAQRLVSVLATEAIRSGIAEVQKALNQRAR